MCYRGWSGRHGIGTDLNAEEFSDKFEGRKGLLTLTKKTEAGRSMVLFGPEPTKEYHGGMKGNWPAIQQDLAALSVLAALWTPRAMW